MSDMNPSDRIRAALELPIADIQSYTRPAPSNDSVRRIVRLVEIEQLEKYPCDTPLYAIDKADLELLLKEREELLKDAAKLEWLINANEADFAAMEYETPEFRRIYIEQAMKQDLEGENQS